MRIGVISDTHMPGKANALPKQLLEDFKKVAMIIHAGDIVEMEVLEKLKSVCPTIKVVQGNMDSPEVRKKFPEKEIIEIGKFRIGVMHGHGAPDKLIEVLMRAFKDDSVNMIIFGHSHTGINEEKEGILFFNPGSPTDTIFAPFNSYGIIEINDTIHATIVRL